MNQRAVNKQSCLYVVACLLAVGAVPTALWGDANVAHAAPGKPSRLPGMAALQRARKDGIDIGSLIDSVSHSFRRERSSPGRLVSGDHAYRVSLDASGFSMTLRRAPTGPEARAFAIRTARVSDGAAPISLAPSSWRSHRNSASREIARGLGERVTARDGRLEWDFLLDRAPVGGGALTIDAQVAGGVRPTRIRGSEGGWRYAVGWGRSVTVGMLHVRDALGHHVYAGLPAVAGGNLSLTVPARILRGAAYPLTIDPVVSPEYPTADPADGPPPGNQDSPAIAFDGTNYLVVWEDNRPGAPYDIYGARVSRAGVMLDPRGIPISTAPDSQNAPDVAFDGTNYLVVWMDSRDRASRDYDIYGARVSPAGTVLDPGGIPISTAPNEQGAPAVAFDQTNFLVVWEDGRNGSGRSASDVYGARVSPAGTVLDPAGIPISTAPDGQGTPAVAFDGDNYFVTWADHRLGQYGIFGARVNTSGHVLDPGGIAISSASLPYTGDVHLAFDGNNYFVIWWVIDGGAEWIEGSRVSRAGVVLDPNGIVISGFGQAAAPAIAFDNTNYLVTWEHSDGYQYDIRGARVSPGGVVLDPSGIAISTAPDNQRFTAVAFDGTNYLVAFGSGITLYQDLHIRGTRVSTNGAVLDPRDFLISTGVNSQSAPAIAFDGTNYLVVWQDNRGNGYDIYAARVSQAGVALDGTGIAISTATGDQDHPAVAFDGTNFLVAWDDERTGGDIYGARVSPAGAVLDPGGFSISAGGATTPSVAFDGVNYLVAWASGGAIDGARVSRDGTVLDPAAIVIGIDPNYSAAAPTLTFDGENYLVAWLEESDYGDSIEGTRVSPAGVVLDPNGIAISGSVSSAQSLASDGTNYFVTWEDASGNIVATRVAADGTVLDPGGIAISNVADAAGVPTVAFNGTDYVVAWQRNGQGIYGSRVSPEGTVLDPGGFAIATTSSSEGSPALALGGAGRVGVTYQRVVLEQPYLGAVRVILRFVDPGTPPPPPPPPTPAIASFTPTHGTVGTSVDIQGIDFTGVTGVSFNGTADPSFVVNSPTDITAHVPAGATTGPISVTTPDGTATSASSFTVTPPPAPTISSFTPTSGPVGTSVDVQGTNLTGATSVKFNGTAAVNYTIDSDLELHATVPEGATRGTISVTAPGGTAAGATSFTVIPPPPAISSFSPTGGTVGTSVSIAGNSLTGATSVTFNGTAASYTVNSPTSIAATVPAGATTGPISVTTSGGTATSTGSFTVTLPPPTITGFTPSSGHAGQQVTITGANLTGATSVKLGGVTAQFTVNSATKITATVPTIPHGYYKWSATTPSGTGSSTTSFHVK